MDQTNVAVRNNAIIFCFFFLNKKSASKYSQWYLLYPRYSESTLCPIEIKTQN